MVRYPFNDGRIVNTYILSHVPKESSGIGPDHPNSLVEGYGGRTTIMDGHDGPRR